MEENYIYTDEAPLIRRWCKFVLIRAFMLTDPRKQKKSGFNTPNS